MIKKGFFKEHKRSVASLIWLMDLSTPIAAAWVSFQLLIDSSQDPQAYINAVALGLAGSALVFPALSYGRGFRGVTLVNELREVAIRLGMVFVALLLIGLFSPPSQLPSRTWFTSWFVMTLAGMSGYRVLLRLALRWIRSHGFNQRSITIIGEGNLANQVIGRLVDAKWSGFRVDAVFSDDPAVKIFAETQTNLISPISGLDDHLDSNRDIDQIWLAMPLSKQAELADIMQRLAHCTADIRYVPDIFEFQLFNHSMSEVAGMPVLNITASPMEGINRVFKAIEDRVLAALILLLASPFMAVIAILIKLSSPGPIFYRQERVGWNGRPIQIYKFRTMPVDAEKQSGPVWCNPSDQRATAIGSILRRTSLDEFPQFYNVIRGDMSIVGPRPERPFFVDKFKDEVPHYMRKHMVKAGITGWAQVNGWRGDTDLNERVKHDLYYIENWSIALDFKIIFLTLVRGFTHKNAY